MPEADANSLRDFVRRIADSSAPLTLNTEDADA